MHVIAHHWPQSTLTAADAHRVNVNSADGLVRAAEAAAAGARRFKYNLHIQRSRIT